MPKGKLYVNIKVKRRDLMDKFKAMIVRKENDEVEYKIEDISTDNLSAGNILIKVAYSSLNYKDMLAFQTKGGIIRNYPMIPGIDLSGTIAESDVDHLKVGQEVIVTSYNLGTSHTGGLSEQARVPHEWVVPLPENLSLEEAMLYGTAGFTAAQSVDALEKHGMKLEDQPHIAITGATGGVGSIALAILAKLGYQNLYALVRKDYQVDIAKKLGAQNILWPEDLGEPKALAKAKYDYVIDTVGGDVAATLLPQIQPYGSMTMCGNAAGVKFNTTVFPIILRGVNILGINSVDVPLDERTELWNKMADQWNVVDTLVTQTISLEEVPNTVTALKEGKHSGRTVVKLGE